MPGSLDRRAAIGAALLAPIATAACVGQSAHAATNISPALLGLIAEYKRLNDAADAYRRDVYIPAEKARDAEVGIIPHVQISGAYENGVPYTWSTADKGVVDWVKSLIAQDKRSSLGRTDPITKHCRQLIAASLRRDRAVVRINHRWKIDEISDHYNEMVDEFCDALWAVVEFPVTTLAELNLKISLIEKEDQFNCTGADKIIIADVRRVAGGEATI